jgi:hypothetical protein
MTNEISLDAILSPAQHEALMFLSANPKISELAYTTYDAAMFFGAGWFLPDGFCQTQFLTSIYPASDDFPEGDEGAEASAVVSAILLAVESHATREGKSPLSYASIKALQNLEPMLQFHANMLFTQS